ncbi:C3HC zinc finger-like-domain-containing protein [Clohesyomyces aquaticus]|uniref:C3HC zinc finger-like-domain-containing protein n=1 Tax=Clohesyomyces aquaticus TaxID=1231657 RepID=A0A1Y1YAW6_9PLEO|nr:C3HC zinc finger-like-domain-containing protein [Clohesyomyces aquaticus]
MSDASPPPLALATSKRKFHKLLDNLTANKSTTSLATTLYASNASSTSLTAPHAPEPAPKRSRLSDASSMDVDLGRGRTVSGERIRAIQEKLFAARKEGAGVRLVGANKSTAKATATPERKVPNFQPYSQEQFLARVKTFADVKKWTTKPDVIGEVEWAKRGWSCAAWNTVACKGGCEARVVVKLRPRRKDAEGREIEMSEDMEEELSEDLVDKYRDMILEGHDEGCLWRKGGCKDDIYHIPIPNRALSTAALLHRYHTFKPIIPSLPRLENITYPSPPISTILPLIPSTLFNPPNSSTTTSPPPSTPAEICAFTFALFGWSGILETNISLATCGHCFQRIGLWLYDEKRLEEMAAKLDVEVKNLGLNLLEAHREHCPWKNGDTQKNPRDGILEGLAGWQTLEFMLLGRQRGKVEEKRGVVGAGGEVLDKGKDKDNGESGKAGADGETESVGVRMSMESFGGKSLGAKSQSGESITEKWKKLKSKLKRSASRKSLKSLGGEKEGKEKEAVRAHKRGKSTVN